MSIAIKVENLSKAYQLGEIGTGTISRDLERWFARMRGKEDPFLKIGEANDRTAKATSDVVWSLKDISFEVQQGDAVGIIGRNGAGKSTLLKILSRVTTPTAGKVKAKGRIASLLEVGTGFHPELSGRENIFLNGAILGMRKKEIVRKFDEIVDFAGVERYIDTPVKRYSSGMYVRLAFAVAAHLDSEILIVDEVLAVGDAEFQRKCLGKMGEVSKGEGRTVLFVSHNMGAVTGLCNSAVLIENGKIKMHAEVSDVVYAYNNSNFAEGHEHAKIWWNDKKDTLHEVVVNRIEIKSTSHDDFYIDNPLFIEITFTCQTPIRDLVVGLNILNHYESPILRLNYNDFDENYTWDKGKYKVVFEIPGYTFANGNYILKCDIAIPNTKSFISDEMTLYFDLKPQGRNGDAYFIRHNAIYNNLIRMKPVYTITKEA